MIYHVFRIAQIGVLCSDVVFATHRLAFHFDVGFVHVPAIIAGPTTSFLEISCKIPAKPFGPVSNGFVCKRKSSHIEHLDDVPQAQLVTNVMDYNLEHNFSGIFQVVERRPRSLVVVLAAGSTLESLVTKLGGFL